MHTGEMMDEVTDGAAATDGETGATTEKWGRDLGPILERACLERSCVWVNGNCNKGETCAFKHDPQKRGTGLGSKH